MSADTTIDYTKQLFPIGRVVSTGAAIRLMDGSVELAALLMTRHTAGDWGDIDSEDWELNDRALAMGSRLMSSYTLVDVGKIWIITEADRSVTTLLLPSDY
jgi:hypothetical protein